MKRLTASPESPTEQKDQGAIATVQAGAIANRKKKESSISLAPEKRELLATAEQVIELLGISPEGFKREVESFVAIAETEAAKIAMLDRFKRLSAVQAQQKASEQLSAFIAEDEKIIRDLTIAAQTINRYRRDFGEVLSKIDAAISQLNTPKPQLTLPGSGLTFGVTVADSRSLIVKGLEAELAHIPHYFAVDRSSEETGRFGFECDYVETTLKAKYDELLDLAKSRELTQFGNWDLIAVPEWE